MKVLLSAATLLALNIASTQSLAQQTGAAGLRARRRRKPVQPLGAAGRFSNPCRSRTARGRSTRNATRSASQS